MHDVRADKLEQAGEGDTARRHRSTAEGQRSEAAEVIRERSES